MFIIVVFSIFITTSDAFRSYHHRLPYSSQYGVPNKPAVFKPIEDLNIPEQGPIALIPEESRRLDLPFIPNSNYGVPKPPVFKPIEDLNLPEQGPSVILPGNSIRQVPIRSSYGVPAAVTKPPVLKPIEDLNIPEQGQAIIPPTFEFLRQVPFSSSYGVPEVRPPVLKPIEDLDLPEQGPVILIPEQRQVQFSSGYGVPSKPATFSPITDLDIPDQGPQIVIPEPEDSRTLAINFKAESGVLGNEVDQDISKVVVVPSEQPLDQTSDLMYTFGYSNDLSSRQESMSSDGVTRGFYSYIDANGLLQRVDYIADPISGYQVLQNPVVQDTPEVAEAKAQFFKLYQEASNRVINL